VLIPLIFAFTASAFAAQQESLVRLLTQHDIY
jgi:hypothetical protein